MDLAYPRPQLVRRQWACLNGPWRFCFDDERRFSCPQDISAWPTQITVPFAPESVASGIGDPDFHVACWYERQFDCMPADDRVILRFGAVDYAAQVWVNGHLAVTHEGAPVCVRGIEIQPIVQKALAGHVVVDPRDVWRTGLVYELHHRL